MRADGVLSYKIRSMNAVLAPFRPARGISGPHLQTVWGRLTRTQRSVRFRREALTTPDDDVLLLDHLDGPAQAPRLLLLHGLEGSSNSVYIQGLALAAQRRGWGVTALNFRSCARDPENLERSIPNRRPRLYHSGETTDFDLVVETLAARGAGHPLVAMGVSLGGNVLLKWLGEHAGASSVRAAATISVPYDLGEGARALESGLGPWYVRMFLKTLHQKCLDAVNRFPEAAARIDVPRMLRSRTFREYDDAATAPFHGMAGAEEYYATCSSIDFVSRIDVPTLCISSEDDPFLPASVLPAVARRASPAVRLHVERRGGHVGFVSRRGFRFESWAEESALDWLEKRIG
ncbi:MAG: alpha/beta fold hydrolase [Thermoanaerobaculia bacterium]